MKTIEKFYRKIAEYLAKRVKPQTIQFTISVSFTIVSVCSMGILGVTLYNRFVNRMEDMTIESSEQLLNHTAINLETYLRNMRRISDAMYYSVIKDKDLAVDSVDEEMNLLYEANKDNLISIACYTNDGKLVAAAPVTNEKDNSDIVDQEWFVNAVSDADTILNITNHSYFNIGCGGQAAGDVLGAQVQIASAKYTPINEKRLPTGEICDVAGTAMDFREFHDIGSRIGEDDANAQTVSGYDHNYILPGNPGEICYAAAVRDPESRRIVEVFTDMPGVQLYTAKELVEQGGKGGITYGNFGGLCFETQQYPNGINEPKFPSPILKAGETFESTTVFRFGIY